MIELIFLAVVLTFHHIGDLPEHIAVSAQTCAPQLVSVKQVDGKIILKGEGEGERVCFASFK